MACKNSKKPEKTLGALWFVFLSFCAERGAGLKMQAAAREQAKATRALSGYGKGVCELKAVFKQQKKEQVRKVDDKCALAKSGAWPPFRF